MLTARKHWWTVAFIALMSIGSLGVCYEAFFRHCLVSLYRDTVGSFALFVTTLTTIPSLVNVNANLTRPYVIVWLVCSATADVFITTILVLTLVRNYTVVCLTLSLILPSAQKSHRTGFSRTNGIVDQIIRSTSNIVPKLLCYPVIAFLVLIHYRYFQSDGPDRRYNNGLCHHRPNLISSKRKSNFLLYLSSRLTQTLRSTGRLLHCQLPSVCRCMFLR